jgi:hypothetical protein
MYKQIAAGVFATLVALSALNSFADEQINLEYQYQGETGVDLGAIRGGPLAINAFTDHRNEPVSQGIQRIGGEPITLSLLAPHALVHSAVVGAFTSSGALLAEGDARLSLEGKLIEMSVQDTATGLEVLIRCELTLINQGRNAWQSAVVSRTSVEGKDVGAAIGQGLDRLITELFRDDYFLIELGIF